MSRSEASRKRSERALVAVKAVLAAGIVLLGVGWAADLPSELGWYLYRGQFLMAELSLSLALLFLHIRRDRTTGGGPPMYDLAAAVLGLSTAGYVSVVFPALLNELPYDPSQGIATGLILLVLIIEALRRTAGPALTIILIAFLVYGLLGHLLPGQLAGREMAPSRLLTQLIFDTNGLIGAPLAIAATIVVVFVLLGHILNRSGGASFFTDLALASMGRYRGGSAKISIVASSLFGSISGSAVSNVATTGIITIPMMRKAGFTGATAGGVEAVASTGGQLMPPIMGASAFLMAENLPDVGYGGVIIAALIPALLYYIALFIQADLVAARGGVTRVPEAEIPRTPRVLRRGWFFVVPFVVLILAIFWLKMEPDMAGLAAILALLLFVMTAGFQGERFGLRALFASISGAGTAVLDIIMITAAAGIIIGVLNETGLSFSLTLTLVQLSQGSTLVLLVAAALISILLGMGMPTIGVYVLLSALVVPALVSPEADIAIEPVAAHLFVLYFGMMSMITPPVAIASFAAASLGQASPMRTAWESMRFGWPAYIVPFLFVVSPSLIMVGEAWKILLAVFTAGAGVWFGSIGLIGYFGGAVPWHLRIAFVAAGVGLMIPSTSGGWAVATNIAGAAVAVASVLLQRVRTARPAAAVKNRTTL